MFVAIVGLEGVKAWMLPTEEFLNRGTKAGSRWDSPISEQDFQQFEIGTVVSTLM